MTRKEIIEMCGSEEQANFAIEILLKDIKPAFIRSCIEAEIKETKKKIDEYERSGFIYNSNSSYGVDWGKPNEFLSLDMSEDEERLYKEARDKCNEADILLYRKNRLTSLITVR